LPKFKNTERGTWKVKEMKQALQKLISKEMPVKVAAQSFNMPEFTSGYV
jgi:hypothetical protein